MITEEILKLVNAKLNGIIGYLVLIGLIFFILATAILIYPQIIQIIFVVAFFVCAFSSFLIAVKISNIKDTFDKILTVGTKKKKS
jgi:hypothetical protein